MRGVAAAGIKGGVKEAQAMAKKQRVAAAAWRNIKQLSIKHQRRKASGKTAKQRSNEKRATYQHSSHL